LLPAHPPSAADFDPDPALTVLIRSALLVLCRRLMLLRLSLLALRIAIVAVRGIFPGPVLVALCRVFLVAGAFFVPSGVAATGADDDLRHAGRCRQEGRCGKSR